MEGVNPRMVVHVDEAVRHDSGTFVAVASASVEPPIPSTESATLLVHATRRVKGISRVEEAVTRRLVQCAVREMSWTLPCISCRSSSSESSLVLKAAYTYTMDIALHGPVDMMEAAATHLVIRQALQDWGIPVVAMTLTSKPPLPPVIVYNLDAIEEEFAANEAALAAKDAVIAAKDAVIAALQRQLTEQQQQPPAPTS